VNEVDLGANEALRPRGIDEKPKAEKGKESLVVGATNEDEHAGGMSLQIEDEVQWKRATSWGALGASCGTKSGSCEPSPRGQLQVFQRGMLEASPDLGLPAAVEALNGILKARFAWRSKDGRDAEQQAQADDLPHGAGVLTGGQIPAIPYTSQSKSWGAEPAQAVGDSLDIAATNVSAVTIDAKRAKVKCNAQLNVTTDGPLTVTLADCKGVKSTPVSFSFG